MLITLRNRINLIIALAFINLGLQAQTTILNESLLTQASFNTFTGYSVTGVQMWSHSTQYGAVMSGFSGQSFANEDWLVSPAMNLSQIDNAKLTFEHTRGPGGSMNVGVNLGWYKAYATANYTGNPATTTWVELTGMNNTMANAWNYIPSGDLMIPASAKSATTRIAFRYQSTDTQSATWEIKNVKVTGQQAGTATFKITNWNTEWLGCADFEPTDDAQQLSNVAAAMLAMNSDIYCIQEVSNTPNTPTLTSLVNLLGSNDWAATMVPANTGECSQRQALVYKKARVQFVSSTQLSTGNQSQGNSYSYNWSSGRFPAVYNVNLIAGINLIPVTLVNIHAKAQTDLDDYTRRKGASEALKTILDGSAYNTKNVILVGDYNDFLIGTNSSTACNCNVSPYKNFMDDTAKYTPITQNLFDEHWNRPVIENFIISNELTGNYITNTAAMETSVASSIPGFYSNTSNHTPVTAQLQFSTLDSEEFTAPAKTWSLYPNPASNTLTITTTADLTENFTTIYDITGRQVLNEKFNETINVSALPAGVYILKIGEMSRKFVKN